MERVRRIATVAAPAQPKRRRGRPPKSDRINNLRQATKALGSAKPYKIDIIPAINFRQHQYYAGLLNGGNDVRRTLANHIVAATQFWCDHFGALEAYGVVQGIADEITDAIIEQEQKQRKRSKRPD